MRSTVAVVGTIACSAVWGCSTTYRSVGSVVAEVRRDEVAAAVKMGDRQVGLEGSVERKELRAEKIAILVNPGEARLDERNVGVLELGSVAGESGKAVCLFDSSAGLRSLADVRERGIVRVVCQFSRVDGQRHQRVPVFDGCIVTEIDPE